ncbi:MAG TPA: hypothetical protein VM406_15785 [Noviherbaspirillum sp.]|nr:hypothetical protein [Noviherbaspirillum sp.]
MPASPPSGGSDKPAAPHLKPGDEAYAGTPGTGEDLCEVCGGTGIRQDGSPCPNCEGTGRVTRGIGGA